MTKRRNRKEAKKPQTVIEVKPPWWRNLALFGGILLFFIIVQYPWVFQGMRPVGGDVVGSMGANHQIQEYEKKTGEDVLWNKAVFSGMPVYHRNSARTFNFDKIIHSYLGKVIYLNIWIYLIGFIGMFYLLRFFKLSWWSSAFSAFAFILIPHYMTLLSIGHFQKFRPIMYMPLVTFFFLQFINRKNLLWLLGFIFSVVVQIRTHHYQVIFYQVLVLIFLGLYYLIYFLKLGKGKYVLIKVLLLIPAAVLIIGMVAQPLFVTGEYTPYSIRGGSGDEASSGLDSGYATNWSMHPLAMFCWVIPRFFGGVGADYWGYMPGTGTYDYFGAILAFLALVGLIANWKKTLIKVLSGLFLFSLLLSFGRHFQFFYDIFFNYLPYFNKFRVPAMIQLVIFMIVVILAGFGLNTILKKEMREKENKNRGYFKLNKENCIKIAAAILIIIALVPIFFGSSIPEIDANGEQIMKQRLEPMRSDGFRLIFFAAACYIITLQFLRNNLKKQYFLVLMTALMLIDLLPYFKKSEGNQYNPKEFEARYFQETKSDKEILKDSTYYRVLDLTKSTFNSNDCSYFYNSIGGYSAAKLSIYQDILESNFFVNNMINWNILKMLNARYIKSRQGLPNDFYYPIYSEGDKTKGFELVYQAKESKPAWFAGEYQVIPEKEKRLNALNNPDLDIFNTAILEENPEFEIAKPANGSIEVTEASFDRMRYKVTNDSTTLFVASEIYYPAGWKCYVDGEEKQIYKTNHVLRSVFLDKPGEHEILFEFKPESYYRYLKISVISHWIAWLLLAAAAVVTLYKKRKITVPQNA